MLPSFGGVTGWAALAWAGGTWFHGNDVSGEALPVPLAIGSSRIRQQAGMIVTTECLRAADLVEVDGMCTTSHIWSLAWEMRRASGPRAAVATADMAAYSDLVSRVELEAWVAAMLPQTGVANVRAALDLMDENAWSWQETALRLVWVLDAELGRPLSNRAIFDRRGRHLATCDLLDPAAALVVEYNGKLHDVAAKRKVDREREQVLADHGITMLTVVERDMRHRAELAERLADARAAAFRRAPAQRAWTIEPPPWWTPTETVAQRRKLSGTQRSRLLSHRTGAAA